MMVSEKSWREKLEEVGGYKNGLLGIPAHSVREMIDEIERLTAEVARHEKWFKDH